MLTQLYVFVVPQVEKCWHDIATLLLLSRWSMTAVNRMSGLFFPLQPPKKDTKQSSSKPKDKPSGGGGKAKKKV